MTTTSARLRFFGSNRRRCGFALIIALALIPACQARAQNTATPNGGANPPPADDKPSWAGHLDTRSNLLGDIAGLRPIIDRYGVSFGLTETTEVLGNPSGGIKQGASVEGLTQMSLGVDMAKLAGIKGGTFNVSAFQIHGRGLSGNLGALDILSSIEADPATRLNELWYQQTFWDGKIDVKLGQQSADLEFITSEYEDLFLNSGFGWPTLPAVDLPSGGPAYPLPTPGVRLRATPTQEITALIGLFNGSPAGLRPGDPQKNDPSGTNFDVSSGAFVISEIQYGVNKGKDASGLPATYKLGAWYNTNRFADPNVADAAASASKRGDWSVYATYDQLVFRPKDSDGGLGLTARVMGAPADRNLVDLFLQGGATYKGAFGRPNDTMGLAVEWAHVGTRAVAPVTGIGAIMPARSSETVIEATYQAQIKPWWQVQPDVQYVVNPGAGLPDPNRPTKRVGDAVVLGLRSVVTF